MEKVWRWYCLKYGVQSTECWPEQFKGTDCVLCNKGWGRLCVVANAVDRWGLCCSGMFSSIACYLVADVSGQPIGLIFRGPDSLLQYVYDYQVMLYNILDERRPHPHHCESLKSHIVNRACETFQVADLSVTLEENFKFHRQPCGKFCTSDKPGLPWCYVMSPGKWVLMF